MADAARFSGCTRNFVLFALAALCARVACAAPDGDGQHKIDCKVYQQQQQVNLVRTNPSAQDERLDTVFYSATRNSCLASIFFTKGTITYGGILDIVEGQMLWVKSYKGTSFSPARIVQMDEEIDEEIKAIELAPAYADRSRASDFVPMKNAVSEVR